MEKLVTLLESAGELNVAVQKLPCTPIFTGKPLPAGMQMEVVAVVEEVTEVEEEVVVGMIEGAVEMIEEVVVDMMAAVTAMHQSKLGDFVVVMPFWTVKFIMVEHSNYCVCSRRRSPEYEQRGRRRSPSYDRGRLCLTLSSGCFANRIYALGPLYLQTLACTSCT